jgi:hypothetical protein
MHTSSSFMIAFNANNFNLREQSMFPVLLPGQWEQAITASVEY